MSEWISVSNRLPVQKEKVLIFDMETVLEFGPGYDGDVDIGYYDPEYSPDKKWRSDEYIPITVTHWMLLPIPPKE